MRRTHAALIVLLCVAACGDGDEGTLDPNDPVDPTATVPAPNVPANEPPPADEEPGERAEPDGGFALIAVGDVEYEFAFDSAVGPCTVQENLIGGSVAMDEIGSPIPAGGVDGAAQLNFVLPGPDWEAQGLQPPQIGLDDREGGVRWQAGGLDASQGVEPDQSSIVSWTLEEGRAEGTATFLDLNAHFAGEEAASVPGRFLIECAA